MPPYLHWNQAPPKGQQVPESDTPCKFSSNTGTQPWASIYRQLKGTPKPPMSHNPLLDMSLHSRQKKSSSSHQNSNTSLHNQETLTSQWYNPAHVQKLHNKEKSTNSQNIEKPHQTQQYNKDEEREEYPAGKGTGEMPTKPNKRGRDRESTWERIQNIYSENDSKSWNHRQIA